MNPAETPLALALSGLSFMMTVIWGGPLLRVLRHFNIGKLIRVEGPHSHYAKMGTPTMGGVMIILPVALLTDPAQCGFPDRAERAGPLGHRAAGRHGVVRAAGRRR